MVVCPACKGSLNTGENSLGCERCHIDYKIREGIPVFTSTEEYWCNVDRKTMAQLIEDAEKTGDWRGATVRHVPNCARHIVPLYRGDAQFILPLDKKATVLDAGSMWGGLTVPVARNCGVIYALDKTWETLRFLGVRAEQLQLRNIRMVVSGIHTLPFPDSFFDCVILNGVLEWLGTEQDIVLDEHWEGRRGNKHVYTSGPEEMQLQALQEVHRVIKPSGSIYIAIENRIGLQYYLGHPDDHVNIRFASVLPRRVADWLTRWHRNDDYRTYTYSPRKLGELVRRAGFYTAKLYAVYPHYNTISRLVPFDIFEKLGGKSTSGDVPLPAGARAKVYVFSKVWRLVPTIIRKQVAPSLAVVAGRSREAAASPRLIDMLVKSGVIQNGRQSDLEVIVANNRFGDEHPITCWVYDRGVGKIHYFCKLSRSYRTGSLKLESEMVTYIRKKLAGTGLEHTIPSLLYAGEADGIYLQVTDFFDGKNVHGGALDIARRVDVLLPVNNPVVAALTGLGKRIASVLWFRQMRPVMKDAVTWLAAFQRHTQAGRFDIGTEGPAWVDKNMRLIKENGLAEDPGISAAVARVKEEMREFTGVSVPIAMQHGDFDLCNLMVNARGLFVTDFEHASDQFLPFFDLGNFLLSPMLLEDRNVAVGGDIGRHWNLRKWESELQAWCESYATAADLPPALMRLLPALSVLEQNAKRYPEYRDPHDYPMYGAQTLKALLPWRLPL